MKKKALRKEFHREITRSLQRFLSILLISALGVAFFAGLRSCKSDMLLSADAFYDATNMMDLRIVSALGLTEDDLAAVRQADGVEAAEGAYVADVMVRLAESDLAVKFYPVTQLVNTYSVLSGRLPSAPSECAMDERFQSASGYRIGDVITVESGTEEEIGQTLRETQLTITGVVSTGRYLSGSRGSSTIGNGKIAGYLVLDPKNVIPDYYTEIYVTLLGAKEKNSYLEEYDKISNAGADSIRAIKAERESARFRKVKEELWETIAEEREALKDKEEELFRAEEEIAEGEKKLGEAYAAIEEAKEALRLKRDEAEQSFLEQKSQLEKAEAFFQEALAEWEAANQSALAAREEYEGYVKQLEGISQGPEDIKKILALKGISEEDLRTAEEKLANERLLLNEKEEEIARARTALQEAEKKVNDEIAAAEEEIKKGDLEREQEEEAFQKAKTEFYRTFEENKKMLADASQLLDEKEKELADMQPPEWYVLGRDTIEAYVGFEQDAERMDAIGKVFPAIFFLVAALVSLTTMTRMVDEERTQIGTLKALGYRRASIAGKYIKYALYATLSGSVVGFLVGGKIFPYIVITTYKLIYISLPKVIMPIHWRYAFLATALAVLCTVLAALASCLNELREQPAELMRPAAPKSGKRILLERFRLLWNRLSFTRKASLRNMFRYKKRFCMTVVGIGGCMALLLVGFGIKDSICVMSKIQYGELWLADVTIGLDAGTDSEQKKFFPFLDFIGGKDLLKPSYQGIVRGCFLRFPDGRESVNLIVLPEEGAEEGFFVFRGRNTGEQYAMEEESIIITEKLADMMGVKAGDSLMLLPDAASCFEVTIGAVAENYIYHYIFLTASLYQKIFKEVPIANECLLTLVPLSARGEEALSADLLAGFDAVSYVSVTRTLQQQIDDMLQSLNVITYVLIVCAGLLAFIVLYNLSNINMNERKRELATLKVLGFYDEEVSRYIYRENVWLTFLGILLGIAFGKLLHGFVITTCEVDMVMFGRIIEPVSYLYSTLLTVLFSVVIGGITHFRLKKINMIESLKSVE